MTERIKIPLGNTLVEIAKSQSFSYKNTSYSLEYNIFGDQLIAQRKIVCGKKVIPNTSYEEFKECYNNIVQEDHKLIGLK